MLWRLESSLCVAGYLYVDYSVLDDSQIRRILKNAYAYVDTMLGVAVEPRYYATEAIRSKHPYVESATDAQPYRRMNVGGKPMIIDLPLRRVIKLHEFGGYFRGNNSIALDPPSLTVDHFNGYVHITLGVLSGTVTGPLGVGLIMGGMAGNLNSLGQFWQFAATSGLDPKENMQAIRTIREAIMRVAQTDLLLQVGRAQAGISASEVFNRDGSSYSRQFSQGQFGLYSDLIAANQAWWQTDFKALKKQVVGIVVAL
jgi:hypothetical protein